MRPRDPYDSTSLAALLPDTVGLIVPHPDGHPWRCRVRARLKRYTQPAEEIERETPQHDPA